jgi:hypothetical protein
MESYFLGLFNARTEAPAPSLALTFKILEEAYI